MSSPYTDLAAELRSIADDLGNLAHLDLPELSVSLDIQPYWHDSIPEPQRIALVDTVASALLGVAGENRRMSDGSWHRDAKGSRGQVRISVFCAVSDPGAQHVHAEVLRLRARIAELEGRDGG